MNSYDKHRDKVEQSRKANGEFGSYESEESAATLTGSGWIDNDLTFEEAREKFEETFTEEGYAEVKRYHTLDSTGEVTRSGKQLKKPKVIKGFHSGESYGTVHVSDDGNARRDRVLPNLESVRTPLLERDGSVTEKPDGSFTIEHYRTGEKWDVRPIDWEETDKKVVGNPLEITDENESIRKQLYENDAERYKKAVAEDPGSVEMRPTEHGYEYDQDQLTRAEEVKKQRQMLVSQAMRAATTEGGRKYVEDSLDELDVEGRWQVKEALARMDEPRYAKRRENVVAAAEEGYGRESVAVPDRVIENKLQHGQTIHYKAIDEGPDSQWREATVDVSDNGELGYGGELRAAMLTGAATRGKSFYRDADGHYLQATNAGWDGSATVFDFREKQ